ncbi:MAG: beta-ketoacyl-ACP synthase II [Thermomicrobiales bacterium]|nr:beta-ketoacyl-ACP synthase II [Thermomicrobiales bacterium]
MQRALVTGLGAVTPYGAGVDRLWEGLIAGRPSIRAIQSFDASNLPVRIAGEVPDFRPADHMDAKAAKRMDRFAHYAVAAAREAVAAAGLDLTAIDPDRIAVTVNTGGGGLPSFEHSVLTRVTRGGRAVSPLAIPLYAPNMAASQVSIQLGITGPTIAGVGACAAGITAITDALYMIQRGEADVVIAGASEGLLTPTIVAGFAATGALSNRNDDPAGACRPYSADRDGTVLAEGGCILVIESEAHAVRRGANVLAEIAGGATTSDAFHVTAPGPTGIHYAKAMQLAMERSGVTPGEVDYLGAHGTGSELGDIAETMAVRLAFGDDASRLPLSSVKGMVGHLIGAAAALSTVSCILAIRDGIVPPTINLSAPDPRCDLDYVANAARRVPVRAAMATGLGFGGQNAAVVVRAVS